MLVAESLALLDVKPAHLNFLEIHLDLDFLLKRPIDLPLGFPIHSLSEVVAAAVVL